MRPRSSSPTVISVAEYKALVEKKSGGAARGNRVAPYVPPDLGFRVRSRWEANFARYLRWLQARGEICSWSYEPRRYDFAAIRRGTTGYIPDFEVIENNGRSYLVEIKGWMDAKSKVRLKRMARYYPGVEVRLVDRAAYTALARQVAGLVPGWEQHA